jgi:hypothetical protein
MSASLIRSRAMVTHLIDRHRWNEITDGAVLQEDATIVEIGIYQELSRKHPKCTDHWRRRSSSRLRGYRPHAERPTKVLSVELPPPGGAQQGHWKMLAGSSRKSRSRRSH